MKSKARSPKMSIPFYRPCLGREEIDEVVATLESGWLTTGPRTRQFEREFARFLGHKHAVAVNSCTAALHLALEAIGLKTGEGVVVPTMTFAATAEVVRYFGARPILADCRKEDFNLDIADAERRIQIALNRRQTVVAIMPMDYGGQIGDVAGVRALAARYGLKVVEDAAHCCPAYYRDPLASDARRSGVDAGGPWHCVGRAADISCYSFYANKAITTGEGGMACTESNTYAQRMRLMSLHGISRDAWNRYRTEGSWYYEIIAPGFKYNLTDLAAAIGIHQLRKADRFHQQRTALAAYYHSQLEDLDEVLVPQVQPNRIHSWHLYVIRLRLDCLAIDRAQVIAKLREAGVCASVHWMPLHMHPYYRDAFDYAPQELPTASTLYPEIITLPLYPGLRDEEVQYVCDCLKAILHRHRARKSHS